MPQQFDPAFQTEEFDPAFEPFDPAFTPVEAQDTGGHWEKRGFHEMWIPNKPVDLEARPDTKWLDPKPFEGMVDKGMQNMRESSLGRAHPILADWATWLTGGTTKAVIEAVTEPDTLATGAAGMLRPKPSLIPKVNPLKGMEDFRYDPSMGVRLQYPESALEGNSVTIGTGTTTNRSISSPPGAGETRLGFEPYVKTTSQVSGEALPYPLNVVPQAVQPRSAQAATEAITPTRLIPGSTPATTPGKVTRTPMKMIRGGFQVKPDGTFVDDFGNVIKPSTFESVPASEALKAGAPGEKINWLKEAYELARGTSAAGDASAPFRQGLGRIGSREWFKAWMPMFKSFGSEKAYNAVNESIAQLPHVQSGLGERAGLVLTDINDISRAEEVIRSRLAERLPAGLGRFIRSTNRGYTAYLNHLRANTFNNWVDDAIAQGIDPNRDFNVMRNIADTVGDLTGRGRLKFDQYIPGMGVKTLNLEQHGKLLSNVFFAPKLMAARVRTLNPSTYVMLDPFTRRKELEGLIRMGAWWLSTATLARYVMGDESVVTDSNNADFGKIKEGNARMDIAGGYQQYLVLASRLVSGKYTSSMTEKEQEFGAKFGAETRGSTATRFAVNKLHPTIKFAVDLAQATTKRPVHLGDRLIQMYLPMLASDLVKIYQENPNLLPWMGPAAAVGMGTQVYEKNDPQDLIIPEENDILWEGGGFDDLLPD